MPSAPRSAGSVPWRRRGRGSGGSGARGRLRRRQGAKRSAAYARMVSSIASRVGPCASSRRTSRLLATSRSSVSRSAPVIALGRLDGRAAGEDGEAREARLLVGAEQVVAPVDRRAQRLLAGGRVARRRRRARRARLQARGDLARGEQPAARGRQLDRQRQPVERAGRSQPPRRRCRRSSRTRGRGPRALAEQRDGVHVGQCRRVRRVAGSGSASGGTG